MIQVFFDSSLVARTQMRDVSPGQHFSVYLGVDPEVDVSVGGGQPVRRTHGFVSKTQSHTSSYMITLRNTKEVAINCTLSHRMPLPRDERIVVRMVQPTEKEVVKVASSDAFVREDGEESAPDTIKTCDDEHCSEWDAPVVSSVLNIFQDDSNRVHWKIMVAPRDTIRVPFEYVMEWPQDQEVSFA
jgi:uncharacterized protein (TIGR02231 family)